MFKQFKNQATDRIVIVFRCQLLHVKMGQEVVERALTVHQPAASVLALDDIRLVLLVIYGADQTFQYVLVCHDTLAYSELVADQTVGHVSLLHLLQHLVYVRVLVEILHGAYDVIYRELLVVQLPEEILQVDNPDYLIKTAVAHGIYLEEVLLHSRIDFLPCHLLVYPHYLVAAGHDGLYLSVAQREHSFYDILLHILYLSVLLALGHHRLDLLLSHLGFFLLHMESLDEQGCTLVQYPHERGGYPREYQHGAGHYLGDTLRRAHTQTFGNQLAENNGQICHDDNYGYLRKRLGHTFRQPPALEYVGELVRYRGSRIDTGENTDESYPYLHCRQELIGSFSKIENIFGGAAAPFGIGCKT